MFSMVYCELVSHYLEYEKEFNLQGISLTMALKDISKLERQIMFLYMSTGIKKERTVKKEMNERHVDLLLVAADDTNHYCSIKDFGRLVGSQYSCDNNISVDSAYMDSHELT